MNQTQTLRAMAQASLLASLTAVGAYVAIPVGPVPIVLQNFFVFLTGLLLGRKWGLASIGIYLLAGALGLPVFAGGAGGIGRMVGPTGGYLWAYPVAVFLIAAVSEKSGGRALFDILAMVLATAVIYTLGVGWLTILTGMSLPKAIAVGMLPFLPGDAVKILAAVPVARSLRPILDLPGQKVQPGEVA